MLKRVAILANGGDVAGLNPVIRAIKRTAEENNIGYKKANVFCSDVFDNYIPDLQQVLNRLPKDIEASEMESFVLFYLAKMLNKKAGCLLTVVNTVYDEEELTAEQRQNSLNNMIKLALETARKLQNTIIGSLRLRDSIIVM